MTRLHKAPTDWWKEERAARERGFSALAGIDEAGRGPLAGPVVAAAVILPFEQTLPGVRDSKAMTPEQREHAIDCIRTCADGIGIGIVDVESIDSMNILRASQEAMRLALANLSTRADVALIDGLPVQPFPIPQIALVKGDGRSASIAAASVVAKVTRDQIMVGYDSVYPEYGFSVHKGYATADHLERLRLHGPCPQHRRSFEPVARLCAQPIPGLELDVQRVIGARGECVAAAHLSGLGWQIMATRFHCRGGELDIVAQDGSTVVFVEVKARRSRQFGCPAEAVNKRKRARLLAAANTFLSERDLVDCECRFDVAEVVFGRDGLATVDLIRNAFLAGE